MTDHPSIEAGTSQCELILAELRNHAGTWVAMPRLVVASGSYNVHSRISDLRKKGGHIILHENRRKPGSKIIQSFYQLQPANP